MTQSQKSSKFENAMFFGVNYLENEIWRSLSSYLDPWLNIYVVVDLNVWKAQDDGNNFDFLSVTDAVTVKCISIFNV